MSVLFGFGMPGIPELLIVAVIVLLLFGSRLPSVMRNLGRGIVEFKKGTREIVDDSDPPTVSGDDEPESNRSDESS